ncbi:MAG: SusD/RagB family nutrient-binding outer membrane lipoprotein [Bacteroidales bacterium]
MKIKYIIPLVLLAFLVSCTEKFEDFNTDQKNPASVAGEALFSNALKNLADQLSTPNVNRNITEIWAQYWTETTYTDEANYDIVERGQSEEIFRYFYRDVLMDLKEADRLISESETLTAEAAVEKANKLHIIDIVNVFVFQQLVDFFGAVPYSEALDINNVYPVYEMGEDIYPDLIARLDAALAGLDNSAGSYGSADLIYGGDVDAWMRFANSEKLKLGIHLSDVNPTLAQNTVEAAVASGVFTSAADEALFPYQTGSPNYNMIHAELVVTGRKDFVSTNTIIDIMSGLNDPRLNDYFDPTSIQPLEFPVNDAGVRQDLVLEDGENMVLFYPMGGGTYNEVYAEGPYTVPAADTVSGIKQWLGGTYGASALFAQHTQVSTDVTSPTFTGLIMTYSEVLFYLAEAAARGFDVGISVEEAYQAGVQESILWWGGTQDEVDAYLAHPDVAYATAAGDWKRKIGYQSWIASYINGMLGYTTWRRLDYPVLNITPTNEDIQEVTDIPVRFTFPVNEQSLNAANYAAASEAIGGDDLLTKIFWDLYDANAK